MIQYHKQGLIGQTKHTASYDSKGKLLREELFSTKGFSGVYSTLYYADPPVSLISNELIKPQTVCEEWEEAPFDYHHFDTNQLSIFGNYFNARIPMLFNDECTIGVFSISNSTSLFFQNVLAHELIFVHEGTGEMISPFGRLKFHKGDYIIIPKGVVYQIKCNNMKKNRFLYLESAKEFQIPRSYRNEYGQMLESAPYCERDFRLPQLQRTGKKLSSMEVIVKKGNKWYKNTYENHLMNVVGWDGYLYPFIFNIKSFCPRVGKLHLPPSVHKVFENESLVVCNFVPRVLDFHKDAVTAPYYHMNIDSEEVLYYLDGEFLSRKGVGEGSMTLHPKGLIHGPQPGRQEASIRKKETTEWAVMFDTFNQLKISQSLAKCRKPEYTRSWLEKKKGK